MSQVTRCPSCGTRFKVVADQLRISQGWVRCGRCQGVFDASQDLQSVPDELLVPRALQPMGQTPVERQESIAHSDELESTHAPVLEAVSADEEKALAQSGSNLPGEKSLDEVLEAAEDEAARAADAADLSDQIQPGSSLASVAAPQVTEPSFVDQARPLLDKDEPLAAEREAQTETTVEVQSADAPLPIPADESKPAALALQLAADADRDADDNKGDEVQDELEKAAPESDELGFIREARRKAFWQSTGMRIALVVGSLAAAAGVVSQHAWQQRDALAAQYPALTPTLTSACNLAGCELQARRQIADVVINGSGFKQLADAHKYQWSLTLENRSDVAVAMPMAELTLTDSQDKPLLRRVIDLQSLGAPAQLQAREEWSVSVPVQVQELDAPVAGYRALVFYP
ncbi:zinc-ribbon domain-containing protein [Comamonas sp. Y33R10-2]|uniref:zinc-ribbon and DUF3426 domain-containing protein n=1 Tax=Comamonas sp. Y33R10-2 TaxID=2853257 RepID=UPI001C5CA1FE|nr:zinc-ribbon and DUF3426 domain-containing protein [Comamonas sp. Y33R10-2]QXZ09404.1 zinc-ribbon domain-containing protein [Comamonas sp. Y33R10-2]